MVSVLSPVGVRKRCATSGLRKCCFWFAYVENNSTSFSRTSMSWENHVSPKLFVFQVDAPGTCEEACWNCG